MQLPEADRELMTSSECPLGYLFIKLKIVAGTKEISRVRFKIIFSSSISD